MANRRRIAALILGVLFAFMLIFSSALIIHEADHDCCGEDCPICRVIAISLKLIRTLGLALLAAAAFSVLSRGGHVSNSHPLCRITAPRTLVRLKIRLND